MDCCPRYYKKINYIYCPICTKKIEISEKERLIHYFLNKNIGKIYYVEYYKDSFDIVLKDKILEDLKNLSKFYVIKIKNFDEIIENNEYKRVKNIIIKDLDIYEESEYLNIINSEFKYYYEWYNSYYGKIKIDKKLYVVCNHFNWTFVEGYLDRNCYIYDNKKLGKFKKEYVEEYAKKKLKLNIE